MSILCSGSFVADILIPDLPNIGPPGSLTYAPHGIHLSPGGHSSNVAIDLAQLGIENIHAVGAVGKDEMGDFLIEQLRNRGVKPIPQIIEDSTTAKNVALLVEGEDRRYIAELTANSLLSSSYLMKTITEVKPSILYQGTLGGLPDIEKNLNNILQKTQNQDILNIVDVIMPTYGWDYLNVAASYIDILHANQLEASNLTMENEPIRAVKTLNQMGIKLAIVSDGQKGVIAATEDYIITMPSYTVKQRDPTGAGDALCAGMINHIYTNKLTSENIMNPESIIDTLLMGQAAGAACVTGLGATTSVKKENLETILEQRETVRNKTKLRKI